MNLSLDMDQMRVLLEERILIDGKESFTRNILEYRGIIEKKQFEIFHDNFFSEKNLDYEFSDSHLMAIYAIHHNKILLAMDSLCKYISNNGNLRNSYYVLILLYKSIGNMEL